MELGFKILQPKNVPNAKVSIPSSILKKKIEAIYTLFYFILFYFILFVLAFDHLTVISMAKWIWFEASLL